MERAREKIATLAPGRLCGLLTQGLRGHHPLFERDSILAAFALPDAPVAREDANFRLLDRAEEERASLN